VDHLLQQVVHAVFHTALLPISVRYCDLLLVCPGLFRWDPLGSVGVRVRLTRLEATRGSVLGSDTFQLPEPRRGLSCWSGCTPRGCIGGIDLVNQHGAQQPTAPDTQVDLSSPAATRDLEGNVSPSRFPAGFALCLCLDASDHDHTRRPLRVMFRASVQGCPLHQRAAAN